MTLMVKMVAGLAVKPVVRPMVRPSAKLEVNSGVKLEVNPQARLAETLAEVPAPKSILQRLHNGGSSRVRAHPVVLCRQGGAWHCN